MSGARGSVAGRLVAAAQAAAQHARASERGSPRARRTCHSLRFVTSRPGIVPAVRIGVLTGGGDCPGLNAVIRAIVRKGIDRYGHAIVGFRDGWRGAARERPRAS